MANRFRGELYRWHVLSADGGAVLASNGMSVNADAALEPLKKGATLLVVAGFEPLKFATPALEHWLRRLDNEGVTLGAIDTGSFQFFDLDILRIFFNIFHSCFQSGSVFQCNHTVILEKKKCSRFVCRIVWNCNGITIFQFIQ